MPSICLVICDIGSELFIDCIKPLYDYYVHDYNYRNPNKETPTSTPYTDDRFWAPFTIPELQYKELAVNLATDRAVSADICHFWNDYLPKLETFSGEYTFICFYSISKGLV